MAEPTSSLVAVFPTHALPCLGFCGGGSLNPASKLDASRTLGQGRCSSCDWQCLHFRGSAFGLHPPLRGSDSSGGSSTRLPPRSSTSSPRPLSPCGSALAHHLPHHMPWAPMVQVSQQQLPVPQASPIQAVPFSGAGVAHATGSALPCLCTSTSVLLTGPTSGIIYGYEYIVTLHGATGTIRKLPLISGKPGPKIVSLEHQID